SDAPHLDAQRILLHVLKQREPSYLLAHSDKQLTPEQLSEITRMQDARKTGMPLAYILGTADFYGRTFIVTPDVLIPRPDTEILIEKALEYIARHPGPRAGIHGDMSGFRVKPGMTIADIGTGSGCIAITLALELKEKHRIIATDISEAALAIAKQNAAIHGVLNRIEFIQGDMLEPFDFAQGKPYKIDLIVSNPPYVPSEELQPHSALRASRGKIETQGLDFEPHLALDGGPDGLKFVNQIKASGIPAIIETIGGEIITTF
ncbi:MAG: peptide chain release factor N(5)-glutamine methyltransferase, partial [Patescibacteria group bacterium]